MKIWFYGILFSFCLLLLLPPQVKAMDYFLGAYFMPKPRMPSHQFFDLKTYNRLPSTLSERRKPLLGYYPGDDQTAMDWQIRWAKEGGLSYFVFDEYWTESQSTPVYNTSLPTFLASSLNSQIQFAISLTTSTVTNDDAQKASDKFINTIAPYMKNTYLNRANYLKIDGKPVVYIFHNPRIFGNNITPAWVASRLQAFEQVVGSEIYWMYTTASVEEPNFHQYKQMGYDALAPYYVAPGITGMMSIGNPDTGIPYSEFIAKQLDMHTTYFQKAAAAGLAFIPSATTNFDERPRYPNEAWQAKRSFTTNRTTALYTSLMQQLKNQIDGYTQTNPSLLVTINNKPLMGLGAWNEWVEDAQLEPGYAGLHPTDPYAILKSVQQTFSIPSTNLFLSTPPDRTPPPPTNTSWNFGHSQDIRYWYVNPTATDILPHSSGNYGTFIVNKGFSTYMEGTVSIDATKYRGIRIPYSAVCGNQSSDCTQSIVVTWFSTNCTQDTNASCTDKTTPNRTGNVGRILSQCTNKPNDSTWGYCDFVPATTDTSWSGTIEQLRVTFFTKQQHPTFYSISNIQLLPAPTTISTPTTIPDPTHAAIPGDTNNDGNVDGIDYIIWLNHYNQTVSGGYTVGDFNTNGLVDGVDYIIWLNNYSPT